jgi:hypothetical protein
MATFAHGLEPGFCAGGNRHSWHPRGNTQIGINMSDLLNPSDCCSNPDDDYPADTGLLSHKARESFTNYYYRLLQFDQIGYVPSICMHHCHIPYTLLGFEIECKWRGGRFLWGVDHGVRASPEPSRTCTEACADCQPYSFIAPAYEVTDRTTQCDRSHCHHSIGLGIPNYLIAIQTL